MEDAVESDLTIHSTIRKKDGEIFFIRRKGKEAFIVMPTLMKRRLVVQK
jgi:hypothetical protein